MKKVLLCILKELVSVRAVLFLFLSAFSMLKKEYQTAVKETPKTSESAALARCVWL